MASNEDCFEKAKSEEKFDPIVSDKDDYLSEYRKFFEKFANIADAEDQLPLKVTGCLSATEDELPGEILSYALQYLDLKECPPGLISPLGKEVLEDVRRSCAEDPQAFGYTPGKCEYMSLKLMRGVVSRVHAALRLRLDNALATCLPAPIPLPMSGVSSSRNGRRTMEDRHVIIDDLNRLFDMQDPVQASFYAVYDGHSGSVAATYCAAHLHVHFVRSPHYLTNPREAMREAFLKTDHDFTGKRNSGGTTAVVCYMRGKDILIGWTGDSQALLVGDGELRQLVKPHKPFRADECQRIEQLGGIVVFKEIWRVNGILAVSRAIGDVNLKPYVSCEPEFSTVKLEGFEDFIVLACDGLWDYATEDEVAFEVYKAISVHRDDIKAVADWLVRFAKKKRSADNVSVVVIFLKDPLKLVEKATWLLNKLTTMDAGFDSSGGAQTDGFHNTNQESPFSKDGIMFKLMGSEAHRQNGDEDGAAVDPFFCPKPLNGNSQTFSHQMEEDDDFGPETDVDAVDDAISSPSAPEKNMFASENLLSSNAPKFDHELVKPEMDPFAQDDQMVDPFARDNHFERDTFEQFEHAAHFEHAGSPDLLHAAHEDNQLAQHHAINELDQFMRQDSERHDASTPPIDAVLEINASLADNVAESGGEESEDEWNYFKGDKAEPAGAAAAQETQLSDECQEIKNIEAESVDEDAMSSPLNPDAAPFVPVSPTRAEPTGLPAHLLADPIIAGSPHKPLSMDNVTVPEPSEFDTEIASRLSDLDYLNGHSDNSALSSQENLKETLHGNEKQHSGFECGDDDIADCQISPAGDMVNPAEFDRVQKDTTGDFCDIQVAYNQHANQPFDDEGIDEELYERLKNKERDPMSMSFYQEKDEDTCETGGHNPFDLNAVQTIPNDSDEEITNERQPDNSIQAMLSGINPFMDKNPEVTSIEINAAISDLDKAVTNEDDSMDHKDFKPLEFDNESVENNIHSPMSDNVSQLTEPSEAGEAEQQELTSPLEVEPAAISQDSALSPEPASPMEGDGDICQISNSVTLESQPIQMDSHLLEQMTDLHVAASPEPVAHEFEPAQSPEPVAMSPSPVPDTMVPSAETNIMAEPSQPQHFDSFGTEQMQDQFSNEAEFKIDSFDQPPNEYSLPKSPRDEQTDKNLDFGFSPDVPAEAPFTNNDILLNFQQPIQQVNEFVESSVVENVQNANDFIPEEISKSFEQNFSEPIQQQSENMLNETELKYDRLLDTVTSLESKFENMSENICEKLPEPSESHFTEISHNNVEPEQYNLMESQKENDAVCNMFDKPVETISAVRDEITDIISAAATEVQDSQIKTESLQQDLVNVDPIQLIAEMKQDEPKENKLNVDLVTPLAVAAVTGVAAAAATAVAAADKKTPLKSTTKTTTTTKKATPLKATSPTKPTAPKVAATTAARKPATPTARTTASPAAAKPAAPKPAVKAATATSPTKPAPKAAAPAPRPKTAPVKAPVADKKPLTNGEVKREPIKKPLTSSVAAKTTSAPKPAPSTTVKSTVSSAAPKPARPATAPARPPTARPATTAAATARAAAPTKTTAAPRPKPATTTATRAPISRPAATKPAAPADKLSKDTANKQISAARPTPAPRATLTNKTSDIKTTSKTTTKTTTTTAPAKPSNPPPIRRPTGTAVKSTTTATTKTATKTTTKAVTKGTSEKMNGSKEQTEICMNGSALITDIPLKDNSPQQVDNSLLPVIDAAAD